MAAAIHTQMELRRRAGRLLDAGVVSAEVFAIGKVAAMRWQALARLDDDQFAAKVEYSAARAIAAMEHGGSIAPRIK